MRGFKYGLGLILANAALASTAVAEEVAASGGSGEILSAKAVAAVAMAIAAAGAGGAQARAIAAALESIGRNPGAAGTMFLPWILALALIESLAILTFVLCLGV